MALKWVRTERRVSKKGTDNVYEPRTPGTGFQIESRKRHIPHANGRPGTWDHTSYFVLQYGKELVEKQSLTDAKEYVEECYGSGKMESVQ